MADKSHLVTLYKAMTEADRIYDEFRTAASSADRSPEEQVTFDLAKNALFDKYYIARKAYEDALETYAKENQ
jgi:hypothetical protein